MNRTARQLALLLGLAFTFFIACKKSDTPDPDPGPEASATVVASVTGRVLDENRNPVNGATVRAGGATATTDVNGNFAFNNVTISKDAAFVSIEKTGYYTGSRTFMARAGATHNVQVQLIPRTISGNFSGSGGGTVATGGGGSVLFPANAVVTASGAAYTGAVSVAAYTYDPTAANFTSIMPGELRGITTGGDQQGLQSFAMMNIELQGAGGEKLQLASGKTATLTMPIPTGLQASAPANIPLWYFDETKGLWKQEGSATKQGNTYVGTVAHFTPWNADQVMGPWTTINARFLSTSGTPLSYGMVTVRALTPDTFRVNSAFIDSYGSVTMGVYPGTQLRLTVSGPCGQVITSQIIGPFTAGSNTNLGDINTASSNMSTVTISGNVTNCNSAPLASGWVTGTYNSLNFRAAVTNGTYSLSFTGCNTGAFTASVVAYDPANLAQGTPVTVNGTVGTPVTANLTACGTSTTTLVSYTINGATSNFVPPGDSLSAGFTSWNNQTYLSTYTQSGTLWNALDMTFPGPAATTGTYNVNTFTIRRPNAGQQQYFLMNSMTTTVTAYGAVGGFIEGTFTGQVRDSANPTVALPITGTYKVKRSL